MLIGLLSDTHDRIGVARLAINLLRANGATHLLHAGDIGGKLVIEALAGGPAGFVWGNNDADQVALAQSANEMSVNCFGKLGELELAGKRIAITHGNEAALIKRILQEQRHDYLLTGHTHVAHDRWQGKCRWINPGALYRASTKTVAILDTEKDTLRSLCIP